jgi:hypothetical protein
MNKNDLITAIAAGNGFSKADAGKATNTVFDTIADALKTVARPVFRPASCSHKILIICSSVNPERFISISSSG